MDDLTIRAAFDSKTSVTSNEKIELSLSRALQPADGSLAVLIGDTDVTGMLMMEAANLSAVSVGPGIVHSGALSGFALPVLRYFVGASESQAAAPLALISPAEGATVDSVQSPLFKCFCT